LLTDIEHLQVDYARDRYAGHPRQGGIFDFGGGEIAVLYNRAPCAYREIADVGHDYTGYHSRSQVILARSLDGGYTWDRKDDVVVFDQTTPIGERQAWVRQVEDKQGVVRECIDLNAPDTALFFGRTWAGEGDPPALLAFALRSPDRGRTWECVPTPLHPPGAGVSMLKDGHPAVRMPDGTRLVVASHVGGIWLYGSDDQGLTWECLAHVCSDPTGLGRPTYAGLLRLPSGRLQCYSLNIGGWRDAIQMCYSDDGGYSWSLPQPIVRWGQSPWVARRTPDAWATGPAFGKHYRSPWPMRLADGRLLVIFARRKPPFGIGVIASEDDGASWSPEQILRDDASTPDIGYSVAVETPPNHIFTAYYYTLADGNRFGGTRFIAGTHFRV